MAARGTWHPRTRQEKEAVLEELERILTSPHFCNSKRYPALLRYIVENTLEGRGETLKERTLGVEVFLRPASYDTNTDTVVRYTAGEVRKRLALYYHELGVRPGVRILLPAGSYLPEFVQGLDDEEAGPASEAAALRDPSFDPEDRTPHLHTALRTSLDVRFRAPSEEAQWAREAERSTRTTRTRLSWVGLAALVLLAIFAGFAWRYRVTHVKTALDDFWAPTLRDQRTVLICTEGTTFVPNDPSGFMTADKSTDYPFVSLQIASSIARLSAMLERHGAAAELQASAATPLTDIRERPSVLLGGYNNQWTQRLLEPLRFHFAPAAAGPAIVDATQPVVRWEREHSLPSSNGDDYALVARFRDATTNSWVVALAGVDRNGTEGAAQFATSADSMQMLRDRMGSDFANRNVEVVLKVNVIDGKTGAPSILALQVW